MFIHLRIPTEEVALYMGCILVRVNKHKPLLIYTEKENYSKKK